MRIGIDASNLSRGGGVTHLINLIKASSPEKNNFDHLVIWCSTDLIKILPRRPYITYVEKSFFTNIFLRILWLKLFLNAQMRSYKIDILFSPGGLVFGSSVPTVTMSRNMLPFQSSRILLYGWSFMAVRLFALRFFLTQSLRNADGVIFLHQYAQRFLNEIVKDSVLIPHGIDFDIFNGNQQGVGPIFSPKSTNALIITYVSTIDVYKHQIEVLRALSALRDEGLNLDLNLIGPAYHSYHVKVGEVQMEVDPKSVWVRYHGNLAHEEIAKILKKSDIGIFASSCENFPNILLEKMATGLPLVCSKCPPMDDILGPKGFFFDPFDSVSIRSAVLALISDPNKADELARAGRQRAAGYTWKRCADLTFSYLSEVAEVSKAGKAV